VPAADRDQTALLIVLRVGSAGLPTLAGLPLLAIRLALLEWFRAAELSCDRAAALVTRDPLALCRSLMVLSAGEAAAQLSFEAFLAQAAEYDEGGSGMERVTKLLQDLNVLHPMPCAASGCCSIGSALASTTGSCAPSTCGAAMSRRCARRPTRRPRTTRRASTTRSRSSGRRSATSATSCRSGSPGSGADPARTRKAGATRGA
jgi:hypothetical protein